MNYELLNYLKLISDRNWLSIYSINLSGEEKKQPGTYSQILYLSIKAKLAQISVDSSKKSRKIAVLIVENSPLEFISAFLACVIAEVNLFLCDPGWQEQEWQQVLQLVRPDFVLGNSQVKSLVDSWQVKENELPTATKIEAIAKPLIMIPTGGTSGKIKFAVHTWETLSASVTGFKQFFDQRSINSFCTLPLYHVSGLMQLMRSLLTQGDLVICPYKLVSNRSVEISPSDFFISLVPTQLKHLLTTVPDWLKEFKTVLIGGAPASQSLLDTAREHQIAIALTYGMTETASGVVALKPQDFLAHNHSNGEVLPHAKILIDRLTKIIDESEITQSNLDSRQTGLISINAASLCLGYYPHLLASQTLITDDLGYFEEGYLYLQGRNSHKIITGGENVFPTEVESVIHATKLVQDICIVGIRDPQWGQAVTAIYVPQPKTDLDLIKQQVRSQLAKHKQPKHWIEIDRIPRNNRGKVNYQKLKAIALAALDSKSEKTIERKS